ILGRHEQALVHEAEGYARATGKPGVCIVTSGPGATNTITAIADAHYDSIPLVVITGQVPQKLIGNDAFQEVDSVGMTRSIVKYGYTVRDRNKLGRTLKMAFYIANSGKPGPVLIDIPKDIQTASGDGEYPGEVSIRGYKPNESVHIGQLKKAYKLLRQAKRPLILAGGGVRISGAEKELQTLAEKMSIPVVTTIMGKGVIPEDHPLYVGNAGMHGRFSANTAICKCDVLLSIGTRFNDRITGELSEFAPGARIIHVDVDTSSISRNVVVDIPVVSDASTALIKLNEWAEKLDTSEWTDEIKKWDEAHPLVMGKTKGLSPQTIMEGINSVFPAGIVTTDVGQNQMWAAQYITLGKEKRMITSGGLGTMGFGLPAAIGAKIGCPDSDVVCITGDGGFQMNIQEMATSLCEGAPVVICLLNNETLGMVRQFQNLFYGKRFEATDLNYRRGATDEKDSEDPGNGRYEYIPDFMKLAESYGARGIRVKEAEDIIPALEKARDNKSSSTIIEFIISSEDMVYPMVKGGNPISEMIL
ncbi:MAG: biosynthetic-type acetolactate synthase large subunit, partial [Lachnospiraceae bacterium]|nr:biosynthetic-type acetolactate synthase large subunit [Lachnospiraceae bacterium]